MIKLTKTPKSGIPLSIIQSIWVGLRSSANLIWKSYIKLAKDDHQWPSLERESFWLLEHNALSLSLMRMNMQETYVD